MVHECGLECDAWLGGAADVAALCLLRGACCGDGGGVTYLWDEISLISRSTLSPSCHVVTGLR